MARADTYISTYHDPTLSSISPSTPPLHLTQGPVKSLGDWCHRRDTITNQGETTTPRAQIMPFGHTRRSTSGPTLSPASILAAFYSSAASRRNPDPDPEPSPEPTTGFRWAEGSTSERNPWDFASCRCALCAAGVAAVRDFDAFLAASAAHGSANGAGPASGHHSGCLSNTCMCGGRRLGFGWERERPAGLLDLAAYPPDPDALKEQARLQREDAVWAEKLPSAPHDAETVRAWNAAKAMFGIPPGREPGDSDDDDDDEEE
ncbi:hypothetical protein C8Q80DRAFT_1271348 [Daedaleopsis nitida]|nr:hypothetical protein C8Q80DRAFT_1271348 [Daedaleopsis nitida]